METLHFSMDEAEARRRARRAVGVNVRHAAPVVGVLLGLAVLRSDPIPVVLCAGYVIWVVVSVRRVVRGSVLALVGSDVRVEAGPDALRLVRADDVRSHAWSALARRDEDDDVMVLHFADHPDWVVVPLDRADEDFLDELRSKELHPVRRAIRWRRAVGFGVVLGLALTVVVWAAGQVARSDCNVSIEPGQVMVIADGERSVFDPVTGETTAAPAANC
ncbi:MAG: hypothetical protein AAGE98_14065 [Actinomycetota bacterium]